MILGIIIIIIIKYKLNGTRPNYSGCTETGSALLSRVGSTDDLTNPFSFFFWWDGTCLAHLGWAETIPAHNPHGCWPDPTTILIKLLSACMTNSLYVYRGWSCGRGRRVSLGVGGCGWWSY